MTRPRRTLLTTGLAWLAGVATAAGGFPLLSRLALEDPETHAPLALAVTVCAAASLSAARIASSRRAGVLEVAGAVAFAALPLVLVQGLSLHPDFAIPDDGPELRWLYRRFDLHHGFAMAEATALACLVGGAVGLLCDVVRWPLAPWLAGLGTLAGLLFGGFFFSYEGWVLGGPLGLAATVFPVTAVCVRGPRASAGRGARCLAVLAVAMGAVLAAEFSWLPREETGPFPYLHLWPAAERLVHGYRVLRVQLIGCGVALAFALASGRRDPGRRTQSTRGSFPVLLVAAVCLAGSVVHLHQQRIEAFNWQWRNAREIAAARLLCTCGRWWERVPTLGTPLPATPLPWPFQGRVGFRFQDSVVRVDVDLTDPLIERVPGELERLRALPVVRLGRAGHAKQNTAPEQRIEAPDDISYGDLLRGLDRAVDLRDTHMHVLLDNGPSAPAAP